MGTALVAEVPVDPSITPISLSHPAEEARDVLERCGVLDSNGVVTVARAGLVPHARDALQYLSIPSYQI